MINNEEIQKKLEAEQQAEEIKPVSESFLAALSLAVYNLYRQYGTEEGLNMSRGNRKKNFFATVTGIVSDHYKRVKELVNSKALGAFVTTHSLYMTAYEKALDLPLIKTLPEKIVQAAMKAGFPLSKTMSFNRKLTLKQLRKQFLASFRKGEQQEQLMKRVDETVKKDTSRVKQVVEHETSRMQSEGQLQSISDADDQGIEARPIWNSLRDGKVREAHRRLHGTRSDENGWFYISADRAKAPRLFKKIENSIRCRCYLEIISVRVKDSKLWNELNSAASSSERRRIFEERANKSRKRKTG